MIDSKQRLEGVFKIETYSLQPVKKVTVSKLVQDRLMELVSSGALVPGDKLPSERAICEQLKVGRSSVREAIEGLCAFGIFEKKATGVYVLNYKDSILSEPMNVLVGIQAVSADDLIEARIAAETQIARIAAQKASSDDIDELNRIIAEADGAKTTDEIRRLSARFHKKLADMTKNPILINMFCPLYDQISRFDRKNYSTIKDHKDILDAIREGNSEKAERMMALHLTRIKESIQG